MRLYSFQNFYLAGIHAGIQTAHSISEMFVKYNINKHDTHKQDDTLHSWADDHKTIIILNGGMQYNLYELKEFFESEDNPYPWAHFCEADFALNGALTNVSIVLPDTIYEAAAFIRSNRVVLEETISLRTSGVKFICTDNSWAPRIHGHNLGITTFNKFQTELIKRMNQCGLMN